MSPPLAWDCSIYEPHEWSELMSRTREAREPKATDKSEKTVFADSSSEIIPLYVASWVSIMSLASFT